MNLNEKIDTLKEELISSIVEIVRIKSVEEKPLPGMPYGEGVARALKETLAIAESMGFNTVNFDGYIGYAEYIPEGVDPSSEEYVGILGHLDVVPEGEGWTYPPYAAEIHEGKIYGRGTTDDKAPIMACLYGLKAIKELKLPISKKVRIIFGTNEESGCGEIAHYLNREKPPIAGFTPDAEYPIIYAEKGITHFEVIKKVDRNSQGNIIILSLNGGLAHNMVPSFCIAELSAPNNKEIVKLVKEYGEKTGYEFTAEEIDEKLVITSKGKSAHGSLPEQGQNAIMQMFSLLVEIDQEATDIMDYIRFFNKYVGMETDGKSFGVGLKDEVSGNLTFNVGVVKLNEDNITMALNLRYPVTSTYDEMMKLFYKRIEGTNMTVEMKVHMAPLYFPKDHKLIKTLTEVFTKHTGYDIEPLAIGGGTYAKEMPNIAAFGPMLPGMPDFNHKVDENIEIEDLMLNARIYADAIYQLAK